MPFKWTNNDSVEATSVHLATPTVSAKRVEMDESSFSDSILEFINDEKDEEEFENVDYLFGQIPEVFTAVVNSTSSKQTAEPHLSSCSKFKRTNSGELQRLIEKNK